MITDNDYCILELPLKDGSIQQIRLTTQQAEAFRKELEKEGFRLEKSDNGSWSLDMSTQQ